MKQNFWRGFRYLSSLLTLPVTLLIVSSTAAFPGAAVQDACANPLNPVVAENCKQGTNAWNPTNQSSDIQIFASSDSVNVGDSLDFFIDSTTPTVNIQIFRIGYYGGMGGRLIHTADAVEAVNQPDCARAEDTGLRTCSNWKSTYTLSIPADWVSGIYLAQVNSPDGQQQNDTVFAIRQDDRRSKMLYQMSTSTFNAYNNYGGKSTYYSNSGVCDTVAGSPRAVKVSFNRPYNAAIDDANYFFRAEFSMLRWLEQQGYDVSYSTNMDTHRSGKPEAKNILLDHEVFLSVGHDEYWSQEMRDAVTAARDAGVHIGIFSANTAYWKVRFESDPLTNEPDSVMVTYKSTENGLSDPSGIPTGTWRDPNGANEPENELLGVMYIGDNDRMYFPLRVESIYSSDPIYRNTGLQNLPPNTYVDVGSHIVGWEWDAVIDNGVTPSGLQILAETPVYGLLLQDAGNYRNADVGQSSAHVTRYTAPSGAIVFASGTIQWGWGLGAQGTQEVEVDPIIQQMTYNLFADMGVQPATPVTGLILDGSDAAPPSLPADRIKQVGSALPPTITNIQIVPDLESITVSWETDTETIGQVYFGEDRDHIFNADGIDLNYATTHSTVIPALAPGKSYFLRIAALNRDWAVTLTDATEATTTAPSITRRLTDTFKPLAQRGACWVRGNTFGAVVMGGLAVLVAALFVGRWWYGRWLRRRQGSAA